MALADRGRVKRGMKGETETSGNECLFREVCFVTFLLCCDDMGIIQ